MKKKLFLMVGTMIIFFYALLIQGKMSVPQIGSFDPAVGAEKDYISYMAADDDDRGSVLYAINNRGKITELYSLAPQAMGRQAQVAGIRILGEDIFYIICEREPGTGQINGWEVWFRSKAGDSTKSLGIVEKKQLRELFDFQILDNRMYLCGSAEENGYIAVYSAPIEKEKDGPVAFELEMIQRLPQGEQAAQAVFADHTLFIRTREGSVGRYLEGGYGPMIREGAEGGSLVAGDKDVWYLDGRNGRLYSLTDTSLPAVDLPKGLNVLNGYVRSSREYILLCRNQAGTRLLYTWMPLEGAAITTLTPSPMSALKLSKPFILRTILLFAVVAGAAVLVWKAYGRNGRISLQLSVLSFIFTGILSVLWLFFLKASGIPLTQQKTLLTVSFGVLVLLLVIYSVFVENITGPLRSLGRFMDKIGAGNYKVERKLRINDEVGRAWESLNSMCAKLEKNRYQTSLKLRSSSRFVPKDMERLLGEESILELKSGFVKELKGNVVLASIQNRDYIRSKTKDQAYMELVNYCFGLICDVCRRHGGGMASSELELSGIRLLFSESGKGLIAFGTELLITNRERQRQSLHQVDIFLMVHKTKYLYGLAGSEEQAFPFFASGEMELLGSYIPYFKDMHVGMVVTEQSMEDIAFGCQSRYIGFLSPKGGGRSYGVYEILNVYSEKEKKLKKQQDLIFQKALQNYYNNNFYMARNQFSAVIKENPADGIARWYLFASEYYFNLGNADKVNYGLFNSDYMEKAGG